VWPRATGKGELGRKAFGLGAERILRLVFAGLLLRVTVWGMHGILVKQAQIGLSPNREQIVNF
jgi:predicted DNA repair protein MutK